MKRIISLLALTAISCQLLATASRNAAKFNLAMQTIFQGNYRLLHAEEEGKSEAKAFFSNSINKNIFGKELSLALEEVCYISMGSSSTQAVYLDPIAGEMFATFNIGTSNAVDLTDNLDSEECIKFATFLRSMQGKGLTFVLGNSLGYFLKKEQPFFTKVYPNPEFNESCLSPEIKDIEAEDIETVHTRVIDNFLFSLIVANVDGDVYLKNRSLKPKIDNYWAPMKALEIKDDYIVDLGGASATLFKVTRNKKGDVISCEMMKNKFQGSVNATIETKDDFEVISNEFIGDLILWIEKQTENSKAVKIFQTGKVRNIIHSGAVEIPYVH